MKITLEFNDDESEHALAAIHGMDAILMLMNLDQTLRSALKYDTHPTWDPQTVEEIREIVIDNLMKLPELS